MDSTGNVVRIQSLALLMNGADPGSHMFLIEQVSQKNLPKAGCQDSHGFLFSGRQSRTASRG